MNKGISEQKLQGAKDKYIISTIRESGVKHSATALASSYKV